MGLEEEVSVSVSEGEGGKAARLPRWTRQEILVLIQGKRDAENKFRRGRSAGLAFGSGQVEPKWASVSSYCRKHGVNRGPVQCRKRWSNLAGDFKKIKEWESSQNQTESFWVMRNDLRRERKLPGFFDKEVYDILDSASHLPLPPPPPPPPPLPPNDSNRSAAAEDALFSDFEQDQLPPTPTPTPTPHKNHIPAPIPISGMNNEKQSSSNPEMGSTSQSQGERKRKRDAEEETLQYQLIDVLERNSKMISAQLEAQNINFQLDREQRKDHATNLVAVLDKLADALGKIADKL